MRSCHDPRRAMSAGDFFLAGWRARTSARALRGTALTCLLLLHGGLREQPSIASAQTAAPPAAIPLTLVPDIPGIIKGGTRPQLIAQGLKGADDPLWIPSVGLVFTEPNN